MFLKLSKMQSKEQLNELSLFMHCVRYNVYEGLFEDFIKMIAVFED